MRGEGGGTPRAVENIDLISYLGKVERGTDAIQEAIERKRDPRRSRRKRLVVHGDLRTHASWLQKSQGKQSDQTSRKE